MIYHMFVMCISGSVAVHQLKTGGGKHDIHEYLVPSDVFFCCQLSHFPLEIFRAIFCATPSSGKT